MATANSSVYKLNNGIEMPALGLGVFRSERLLLLWPASRPSKRWS
jgi:hypothetical protein